MYRMYRMYRDVSDLVIFIIEITDKWWYEDGLKNVEHMER